MKNKTSDYEAAIADTLRRVGVRKGLRLLDFGCGWGDYAIPAARLVENDGVVYAVDKDASSLNELHKKTKAVGITNIKIMRTTGNLELPFESNSIDFILLYDVLHHYYFTAGQRVVLFKEIRRIAQGDCTISVCPKHMDSAMLIEEMSAAGIVFQQKKYLNLLHYHEFEQDYLFNFSIGTVPRKNRA